MATIVLAMTGGLAYVVAHSQARARDRQVAGFARKAALTARLTAGAIVSSGSQALTSAFGGPAAGLAAALARWEQVGPVDAYAGVYAADGRLLAGWAAGGPRAARAPVPAALLERALHGSQTISDLVLRGAGRGRVAYVWIASPFPSRHGTRVAATLSPAATLSAFAEPYLKSAPSVAGASAFLLDGAGRVIGSSSGLPQGAALPDLALGPASAPASRGRGSGPLSGVVRSVSWAAAAVRAGTAWRILFAVPTAALLAPVAGSNLVSWLLFGAFVAALVVLIGVAVSAVSASAALATSRARETAAQALAHERMHDPVTGLPNRLLLLDRAEQALARIPRTGSPVAVLFADLDRFKRVNDSLGHAAGDLLLAQAAERLQRAARPGDTVTRLGGDEFVVLCDEVAGEEQARELAARISAELDAAFDLPGIEMRLSCCIGIALQHPSEEPVGAAELVRRADVAMYSAKATGQGRIHVFEGDLAGHARRRLNLEVELRSAVERGELQVHYQPIVALPAGTPVGVEALARWRRPGEGWVSPMEFIGVAEEIGLISDLGIRVLRRAVGEVRSWHDGGLVRDDFMLSVNVSPRQLSDAGFAASVGTVLEDTGLPPSMLCLEITESAVVADPLHAEQALGQLSALGVRLAIDDFGVGLSSLRQLARSLQVDVLKLDQSFVANIDHPRERAVVAAVASIAGGLGMAAIAEGVERAEQREELTALGYELAQGYLFGKPVAGAALRDSLAQLAADAPGRRRGGELRTFAGRRRVGSTR